MKLACYFIWPSKPCARNYPLIIKKEIVVQIETCKDKQCG